MKQASMMVLLVLSSVFIVGCHSHEIAYISDAQRDSVSAIINTYTAVVMSGDQLYVHVSSENPEAVIPFNQETRTYAMTVDEVQYIDTTHKSQLSATEIDGKTKYITTNVTGYIVNQDGTIDFPLLGKINAAGLTHEDLAYNIEDGLKRSGYVIDPKVTITLMNFRVTVIGEVKSPQQIHVDGTRLTILEAIAICGDLTIYGQRENVTIIRNTNNELTYGEVNLTNQSLFDSPYYYLHQNDIVFIEPNNLKKRISTRDPNTPRYVSIGVGTASSVRNVWMAVNAHLNLLRLNK